MQTLYSTVHHEMIGPLKTNVTLIDNLLRSLDNFNQRTLAEMVMIGSKSVLLHANDLLDMQFLQRGSFKPSITQGEMKKSI